MNFVIVGSEPAPRPPQQGPPRKRSPERRNSQPSLVKKASIVVTGSSSGSSTGCNTTSNSNCGSSWAMHPSTAEVTAPLGLTSGSSFMVASFNASPQGKSGVGMESMESVGGYFHSDQLSSLPSCASTEVGQRATEPTRGPSASIIPDSNANEIEPSSPPPPSPLPPQVKTTIHEDSGQPQPVGIDADQGVEPDGLIQQSTSWDLPPSSPSPEASPDSKAQYHGMESELLRKFSEGRFPFKTHHSWQSCKSQTAEARLTALPDDIELTKSNELSKSNETKDSDTVCSVAVGGSLAVGLVSPGSSDVGGVSADPGTTPFVVWPTGQRTRVCLLDTCRLAAASIEEVVRSADTGVGQESHYATLLASLCPICKHRVVRDLLKVRKVIRQIIVLQTRFRWRLAHRRKLLERRHRMGGLDPHLYDQQAFSTKGRCFRCIPLLDNLRERIAWHQRKGKTSCSFRSEASIAKTTPSLTVPTEASFGYGVGSSSGGLAPEPSAVLGQDSSLSSEHPLKPSSQLQGSPSSPMSQQSAQKGKEQFLREIHQLTFELCTRCQETARAELQILRNNRLSSLGKGKTSSHALLPAKTKMR